VEHGNSGLEIAEADGVPDRDGLPPYGSVLLKEFTIEGADHPAQLIEARLYCRVAWRKLEGSVFGVSSKKILPPLVHHLAAPVILTVLAQQRDCKAAPPSALLNELARQVQVRGLLGDPVQADQGDLDFFVAWSSIWPAAQEIRGNAISSPTGDLK